MSEERKEPVKASKTLGGEVGEGCGCAFVILAFGVALNLPMICETLKAIFSK